MPGMRTLTATAVATGLLVPAIAPADTDHVINVYPPQAWSMYLPKVRAKSGIEILLPSKMRTSTLADKGNFRAIVDSLGKGNYDFTLTNSACPADVAACRNVVSFSGTRDNSDPALSGDIKLAKGRRGSFDDGSCTGGGCTPPSITWVERGARYAVYGYVPGRHKRRLTKYVNDAIRSGPR